MQHTERVGKFEVDHFDPRQKKNLIQDYSNLFPSTRHCNGKKNDIWPSKEEVRCGCRFLNPCEEIDYGEQLFENYQTHFLFGVTPAAKWHIRVLGLNADHLVNERRKRFEYWFLIQKRSLRMKPKTDPQDFLQISEAFRKEVELMIPNIPEK